MPGNRRGDGNGPGPRRLLMAQHRLPAKLREKCQKTTLHTTPRAIRRKAVFCRFVSYYSAIRIPPNVMRGHPNACHHLCVSRIQGRNQTFARTGPHLHREPHVRPSLQAYVIGRFGSPTG